MILSYNPNEHVQVDDLSAEEKMKIIRQQWQRQQTFAELDQDEEWNSMESNSYMKIEMRLRCFLVI